MKITLRILSCVLLTIVANSYSHAETASLASQVHPYQQQYGGNSSGSITFQFTGTTGFSALFSCWSKAEILMQPTNGGTNGYFVYNGLGIYPNQNMTGSFTFPATLSLAQGPNGTYVQSTHSGAKQGQGSGYQPYSSIPWSANSNILTIYNP
jgi:hypothetical protein